MNVLDFEVLFRMSPYPCLILDSDFIITDANHAYLDTAHVGSKELIGKKIFELLESSPDPDSMDKTQLRSLLEKVIVSGRSCVIPVAPQIGDDTYPREHRWHTTATPLAGPKGTAEWITLQSVKIDDIGNKICASDNLLQDSALIQQSMLAARVGIWHLDLATNAFTYSPHARELLGDTPDTLDYFVRCLYEEDREKFNTSLQHALIQRSSFQENLRLVRSDNREIIRLDLRGDVHVNEQDEPIAVKGSILDVTDHMIATEKLRLADRQKDDFLAMLAHELRNPLAPISSAAQLMTLTQPNQEQVERSGEIITRQIKHMVGLVNDLLDVSRVTRGLITTEKNVVDIKHAIYEAIEQSTPLIQARQHRINIDLTPEEVSVVGDQKRLVQVFTNLLTNAAKYTPNGGNITVQLVTSGDLVRIKVIDNGVGIAAELLPRIFDPFAQAQRSADRSQGGLGIGLALVKNLVELHGGKVSAYSNGNNGSEFEIQLPRIHAPTAGLVTQQKVADKALRILVVDDNEDAANTLAQVLQTLGHDASVAYDARNAIESAVEKPQDVFLLDIGLPEMDGNALVRYLRAQPETSRALIIAITGYGAEENKREAMAAGFDEYLVKPVDITELEQLISHYRSSLYR